MHPTTVLALFATAPVASFLPLGISARAVARNSRSTALPFLGTVQMSSSVSANDNIDASAGLSDIGAAGANTATQQQQQDSSTEFTSSSNRSWKSRMDESIGKSRKTRGSNYVQISTVADGEPRCRTVVFRGFQKLPPDHGWSRECDSTSCVMKMITDNRSNKVSEASQQSKAEMVWWFAKTKEQYRIRGDLRFVGGGVFDMDSDNVLASARKEQWGNLSDPAREQFFWQEPGIPYSGPSDVPAGGRDEDGSLLSLPDTFLLMLLVPRRVDYLRLTDNYRQVDEYKEGAWVSDRLNP